LKSKKKNLGYKFSFVTLFDYRDGELQTTVFLGLNFDSTFVVIGQGLDLEAALDHAALQALRFLKSLFSPSEVVNL